MALPADAPAWLGALRESERRYRELASLLPQIVYEMDITGRLTFANRQAFEAFGYSQADFERGVHALDIIVPAERGRAGENFRRVMAGERLTGNEYTVKTVDGRTFPAAFYSTPMLRDGQVVGIRGLIVDITERKRAEQTLRQSEQRFRSLVENAVDAIFVHDLEGRLLDCNQCACQTLGYSREELLTMRVVDLDTRHTAEQSRQMAEQLEHQEAITFESEHRRRDGSMLPVEIRLGLLEDSGQRRVLAIARDISERRQAQQQLERSAEQLRQAQKLEAVGRLAGGVSHDFNNQLTIIQGYCDLLLRELGPEHPHYDPLTEIRRATERATGLTGQLLAFSRRQVLRPEVVDLNAVLADLQGPLARMIGEDILLDLLPGAQRGTVWVDRGQFEQAIMNLAINARDAMEAGGKLVLETRTVTLGQPGQQAPARPRPGCYVLVLVSDTGTGMAPELLDRIFDPFFTTKPVGKGTGLGLAMVYGFVEQSGGHIEVTSQPGQGSTFRVYLPLVTEATPAPATVPAPLARPAGSETILVVEDDERVRLLTARILRDLGYNVLVSPDAREALPLGQGHEGSLDLLLTDVVMPEMGGEELADRLRRARPDLRVLYMSGYADHRFVARIAADQGAHFLQKPFCPEELAARVRDVLDA